MKTIFSRHLNRTWAADAMKPDELGGRGQGSPRIS